MSTGKVRFRKIFLMLESPATIELDDTGEGHLYSPSAPIFGSLYAPSRYKGMRGGRGAAKSHWAAQKLIEDAAGEHHRIACLREFQSSLADSSKKLLEDKIKALGFESLFRSTQQEIVCPSTDSLFVFKGLQGNNVYSLKSLEGFSRGWVEEAQTVSQASLDIMTPTFRRTPTMTGEPEMIFSWNPREERDPVERFFLEGTDELYRFVPGEDVPDEERHVFELGNADIRFDEYGIVQNTDILKKKLRTPVWMGSDFVCVTSNYYDNPWFPADLQRDMERDRRRDPDRYRHIWLGEYQKLSQARVFRNWRIAEFEAPPDTRFFFGADWGFGDPTVLVRCFLIGDSLHVDYETYRVNCPIDELPVMFSEIPGSNRWPIRADSARPETIEYMKRHGYPNMTESVKGPGSVEDGVEFLKAFDIVVHPRCRHTSDELSRYSFKVDKKTNQVLPQLEDKNNHVIDALRYSLEGERLAPKAPRITRKMVQRAATHRPIYQQYNRAAAAPSRSSLVPPNWRSRIPRRS